MMGNDTASQSVMRTLVAQARQGDLAAFDSLTAHFREGLLAQARVRVVDVQEAEDLVQEVLVLAWRQLDTLREDAAFGAWLHVIMLNACRRWQQRHIAWPTSLEALEQAVLLPDPAPLPLDQLIERERWRRRRQALAALPDTLRVPLLLFALGHCTYDEIARQLALPVTTIEGRIARARRSLRQLLQEDDTLLETPKGEDHD